MKRGVVFVLLLVLPVILGGCAATLENYKAKSSAEESAIKTLISYQRCYNSKNVECFMATFHDNAKIMSKGRRFYTKEEYSRYIPKRMKEVVKISIAAPTSIRSERKQVVITVPYTLKFRGGETFTLPMTFYLVKEGQRYLIVKTRF